MSLVCAISQEIPEQPVISPSSGAIFERRLIEKYILANAVDPISGEKLDVSDLIEVKSQPVVRPRPPSATSIPALLKIMQDEWDSTMLHSFSLRNQLQIARQELSHALYQHDAACRVIARLRKQVGGAQEALASLQPESGKVAPSTNGQATAKADAASADSSKPDGLSADIIEILQAKANVLTEERRARGRTLPKELVSADQIKDYKLVDSSAGIHSSSVPGILALDICSFNDNKILTGGNDKNAHIFNRETQQVVSVFRGHTKKVNKVIYHPEPREESETVITASPDTAIRVWNVATQQTKYQLNCHKAEITALSLHPTGDFLLSTSYDKHWGFSDISTGKVVSRVPDSTGGGLTSCQFHPDGLIFGTGSDDSMVKVWDVKDQTNVANFPGHTGQVTNIAFSENGYYLATAACDSSIKIWDLRKLKNIKTLQMDEGYIIQDLCFDRSGNYMAFAGTDVRIYLSKHWQELACFNDHTSTATGVRFGHMAEYIASASMDRTVKFYSLKK